MSDVMAEPTSSHVVLGDVRRHIEGFSWETWEMTARWRSGTGEQTRRLIARREPRAGLVGPYAVSYTHLTLPTN